jgi:cyclopropane-fatty-acyl-phospholipid synthase
VTTVAATLAAVVRPAFGATLPVAVRAWDGSVIPAGDPTAPTVVLRSPDALRRLLWAPGEIGLSRAYVTGELDVEGDLGEALRLVRTAARYGRPARLTPATVGRALLAAARLGVVKPPLPRPASEARPTGRRHSRRRDAAVISHHYDLSNALYTLLLDDEHVAYSCGYWTSDDPGYTVADAQRDKLDLICRKLGLRPGSRLLDVGCGWGALPLHAAQEYGARVTGVTISREQLAFGRARVAAAGVDSLVELRLQDYRDVADGPYDAISTIEMGEHVGAANYPRLLATLHGLLREEGRLLTQQMSHGPRHPGGGPFIESYIAPDMHMRPLPELLGLIEAAGFEIRDVQAMREHYVRTVEAWRHEFESRWEEVVGLVGLEQARVWRLYLVGGALTFEQNRMGVDQVLSVKPTAAGRASMPSTRLGWEPGANSPGANSPGANSPEANSRASDDDRVRAPA